MAEIILPQLGEGVKTATLACWHVKIGDKVTLGQEVCEVVTDKATFNIEALSDGIIKAIHVKEGSDAAIGSVLGVIG